MLLAANSTTVEWPRSDRHIETELDRVPPSTRRRPDHCQTQASSAQPKVIDSPGEMSQLCHGIRRAATTAAYHRDARAVDSLPPEDSVALGSRFRVGLPRARCTCAIKVPRPACRFRTNSVHLMTVVRPFNITPTTATATRRFVLSPRSAVPASPTNNTVGSLAMGRSSIGVRVVRRSHRHTMDQRTCGWISVATDTTSSPASARSNFGVHHPARRCPTHYAGLQGKDL